jgi:Protein of unknown function (DUF2530)
MVEILGISFAHSGAVARFCYMSDPRPVEPGPDADADAGLHGLLVQAPIAPLDENGIVVTTVGTAAFAIAAVVLGLEFNRLTAAGDGWWLWVAIAGAVLGLIGLLYCWRRRSRQ